MRLRTFKIPEGQALRLANRAEGIGESTGDLVRMYVDEYLSNPEIPVASYFGEDGMVLRSFYLNEDQDNKLTYLADNHKVTVGMLFRMAISKGLG
jgi:hypothetical protein